MPGGADHAQVCAWRKRLQKPIDAFVGRQATDEQHATPILHGVGHVAQRVGAAVDDPRACQRRTELAG